MADPFQELGITRRPLFQMFGLPEDRGASSPRMAQAVQNDRITQAAQMKLDQDIADIERRGQAEAAADEFVRQNPDAAMAGSRRYNDIQQYQQMQQRGPSYSDAVLSRSLANRLKPAARERFYQNLEAGMGANASYDDAEAEEEDMKLRVGLAEAGVPLEALPPPGERIDPVKAAALRAAQKGGGGRDKLDDMNMYAKRLEDDLEGMRKKNMGLDPEQGQEGYDAYAAKMDELGQINQMRDEVLRNRFLKPVETGTQKKIVGAVAEGNAAGASGATPPPAAPTVGFMDTMRKAAKPEDILRVDEKEIIEGVNDPSADENTFMAAIQDPKVSLPIKQMAAEKLRQLADAPKKVPYMTLNEAEKRKKKLVSEAEKAEKVIRMYPEVQKYSKAWDDEKAKVAGWVKEYSDSLGIDEDALTMSLAKDEPVKARDVADTQAPSETYRNRFEKFVRDKYGKDALSKKAEKLEPFTKSEFAEELGVEVNPFTSYSLPGLVGQFAQGLGVLPSGAKTYRDVLDAYLGERQPPVAGAAEADTVAAPPKIEIGKPRRIQ